nr:PH domain-containing protein [Nocardiopsis kunsanensis]
MTPGPVRAQGPFDPPEGTQWIRVSRALAWYRRLAAAGLCLLLGGLGGVMALVWGGWAWALAWVVATATVLAVSWFVAGAFQRSWGFVEAQSELYLTYGVLLRQLVVVPYGRMQVVDMTADLLEQALGIATVRIRTAASTADTKVLGLPLEQAVQLRGRLAARSESFSTGL